MAAGKAPFDAKVAKFTELSEKLKADMAKLNAAAKNRQPGHYLGRSGRAAGGHCKTCHDAFRN